MDENPCGAVTDNKGTQNAAAHGDRGVSRTGDGAEDGEHEALQQHGQTDPAQITDAHDSHFRFGSEDAEHESGEYHADEEDHEAHGEGEQDAGKQTANNALGLFHRQVLGGEGDQTAHDTLRGQSGDAVYLCHGTCRSGCGNTEQIDQTAEEQVGRGGEEEEVGGQLGRRLGQRDLEGRQCGGLSDDYTKEC